MFLLSMVFVSCNTGCAGSTSTMVPLTKRFLGLHDLPTAALEEHRLTRFDRGLVRNCTPAPSTTR